jgi:hypothetical protein
MAHNPTPHRHHNDNCTNKSRISISRTANHTKHNNTQNKDTNSINKTKQNKYNDSNSCNDANISSNLPHNLSILPQRFFPLPPPARQHVLPASSRVV